MCSEVLPFQELADRELRVLRGLELMEINPKSLGPKYRAQVTDAARSMNRNETIKVKEESFTVEVQLAGAEKLSAGETYTWNGEIRLPAGAPPSFQSKHMKHSIEIQAGIDAPGNDPDSGWIEVHIG